MLGSMPLLGSLRVVATQRLVLCPVTLASVEGVLSALDFASIELAGSSQPGSSSPWCTHVLHYCARLHYEVTTKL